MRVAITKTTASMVLCIVVVLSELSVFVAVIIVGSVIGVDLFPKSLHFPAYALSVDHVFGEELM